MAILSKPRSYAAHWYTRTGAPMHTVPSAKDGTPRNTKLNDARRLSLVPSVTGVLGILDKPQLNDWKIAQAIRWASVNPKLADETTEYYAERGANSSAEQVDEAADLGSAVHDALEAAFQGREWDCALEPYVCPALAWFENNGVEVLKQEFVVVNRTHGFAGKCDLAGRINLEGVGVVPFIGDWKTRKTVPGKDTRPYDTQVWQVAAYAASHYGEDRLGECYGANLFISTTEPGRFDPVLYTPDDLLAAWEGFKGCCQVWRVLKNYDPRW